MKNMELFYELCNKYEVELSDKIDKPMIEIDGRREKFNGRTLMKAMLTSGVFTLDETSYAGAFREAFERNGCKIDLCILHEDGKRTMKLTVWHLESGTKIVGYFGCKDFNGFGYSSVYLDAIESFMHHNYFRLKEKLAEQS